VFLLADATPALNGQITINHWIAFAIFVTVMLVLDLTVFHKKSHEPSLRESAFWTIFWSALALAFNGLVWWWLGGKPAIEFLTGYLVEWSLSMDNVFVFAVVFAYFGVPLKYQYRVLFWGILAVIVLRGLMIGVGAALVERFGWVLYIFAAFLVITGVKMLFAGDEQYDVESNPVYRFLRKRFRMTDRLHGEAFFVRQTDPATGKLVNFMTPLFVVLVMVNVADVIFAVDSVPAIFAITTDTFIVYTSNIFAILGLRALYFALAAMVERFKYLKYALALVLVFIGGKIFVADMLDLAKVPPSISLGVTFAILGAGVAFSLWRTAGESKKAS